MSLSVVQPGTVLEEGDQDVDPVDKKGLSAHSNFRETLHELTTLREHVIEMSANNGAFIRRDTMRASTSPANTQELIGQSAIPVRELKRR